MNRVRPNRWFFAAVGLGLLVLVGILALVSVNHGHTTRYRIPSTAMSPTLTAGDTVSVEANSRSPRVGDIVVFHPPAGADAPSTVCGASNEGVGHRRVCGLPTARQSSQTFIKRVVAGPGDRIAILNGYAIRNGVQEKDSYVSPCGGESSCNFPVPVVVPRGEYFMLGDNRGASDDSRFWGPVPHEWIIGTVVS